MTPKESFIALLKSYGEITEETIMKAIEDFYVETPTVQFTTPDQLIKDWELNYWTGRSVDLLCSYSTARSKQKKIALLEESITFLNFEIKKLKDV